MMTSSPRSAIATSSARSAFGSRQRPTRTAVPHRAYVGIAANLVRSMAQPAGEQLHTAIDAVPNHVFVHEAEHHSLLTNKPFAAALALPPPDGSDGWFQMTLTPCQLADTGADTKP